MDLVSQRYSDPYFFMDGMIQTGRFHEFVSSFMKTVNKEKEDQLDWEFFLHKVYDKTFSEFKEEISTNKENQNMPVGTIEATVKDSLSILNNFTPE